MLIGSVFEILGPRPGLVASFNQPGGNVTGSTSMNLELNAKLLGLLHELLPQAVRFAVLVNPNNSTIAEATITDARAAAMSMGRQIVILTASNNREIDMVFASMGTKQVDALLVNNDPLFNSRRVHLVTLEPISKSSEQDNETSQLNKANEVLGVVLPSDEDATLPLNPGKEAFDQPAPHVAA